MKILKTIGYIIAAIILIPIACVIISAFVLGIGEESAPTEEWVNVHPPDLAYSTPTPELILTSDATLIPTVIATPKVTPAPQPKVGTYDNPVPMGESFLSNTGALRITITEVERGYRVYEYCAFENMFNSEPAHGNEYMVTKIKFEYLFGDYSYQLSGYDFDAYSNNVECEKPYLVMPDKYPEMGSIDLMAGGVVEKWVVYEVPKGEQVTIAYDRLFALVDAIYYFDAGTGNYP